MCIACSCIHPSSRNILGLLYVEKLQSRLQHPLQDIALPTSASRGAISGGLFLIFAKKLPFLMEIAIRASPTTAITDIGSVLQLHHSSTGTLFLPGKDILALEKSNDGRDPPKSNRPKI